ncbi:MAG: hypothetical protein ACLSCV_00685 [Acutalibacteraceae bacterium]
MKHKIHFHIKKNDVVQLEITGMTAEGWGVGPAKKLQYLFLILRLVISLRLKF